MSKLIDEIGWTTPFYHKIILLIREEIQIKPDNKDIACSTGTETDHTWDNMVL